MGCGSCFHANMIQLEVGGCFACDQRVRFCSTAWVSCVPLLVRRSLLCGCCIPIPGLRHTFDRCTTCSAVHPTVYHRTHKGSPFSALYPTSFLGTSAFAWHVCTSAAPSWCRFNHPKWRRCTVYMVCGPCQLVCWPSLGALWSGELASVCCCA